jgi:hypothetical protein
VVGLSNAAAARLFISRRVDNGEETLSEERLGRGTGGTLCGLRRGDDDGVACGEGFGVVREINIVVEGVASGGTEVDKGEDEEIPGIGGRDDDDAAKSSDGIISGGARAAPRA